MSSLFVCSLSNGPIIDPVISVKTGHLYERSTILKHLESFHTCPMTDQPMESIDLISVVGKIEQNPSTTSIPNALEQLQKQYDNAILEAYYIKKSLKEKREELACSLYREEAAIRVIAKIKKQRDQLRQDMAKLMMQASVE